MPNSDDPKDQSSPDVKRGQGWFGVIVAGGSGTRMGAAMPKQFLPLAGRPILAHTLEHLSRALPDAEWVVVLPSDQIDYWAELCRHEERAGRPLPPHRVQAGGSSRAASVAAGVSLAPADGQILIHDGVRPLVSKEVVYRLIKALELDPGLGGVSAGLPVKDSLRRWAPGTDTPTAPIDRATVWAVQTPQMFGPGVWQQARARHEAAGRSLDPFTDDLSLVEAAGYRVGLALGDERMLKITTPADLIQAETYFNHTPG